MAKITIHRPTTGGELHPEVVFDGPLKALAELNAVKVDYSQVEKGFARLRIPFHIPWVDSKYFYENQYHTEDAAPRPLILPFTLPPTQEWFGVGPDGDPSPGGGISAIAIDRIPPVILDQVMFSFDQRDAPAGILSQWAGQGRTVDGPIGHTGTDTVGEDTEDLTPPDYYKLEAPEVDSFMWPNPLEGTAAYDRLGAYRTVLGIYEKEQMYFNPSQVSKQADSRLTRRLWQAELVSEQFGLPPAFNPTRLPASGVHLRPYRTYALSLWMPDLHDKQAIPFEDRPRHCAMYSIWVHLVCRVPLMPRDFRPDSFWIVQNAPAGGSDVQTIRGTPNPKVGPGLATTSPLDFTPGEARVAANEASGPHADAGFADVMGRIDDELQDGLRGGHRRSGLQRPEEHMQDDAAYDMLRVNLGHSGRLGTFFASDILSSPHSGEYGAEGLYQFGFVQIPRGFVVHHVIMALNWLGDMRDPGTDPGQGVLGNRMPLGKVLYECGVTIATLGQGDVYGYQQVAHVEYDDSNSRASQYLIDVLDWGDAASRDAYIGALVDVPLVRAPFSIGGYGYTFQPPNWLPPFDPVDQTGLPFYVGKGLGDARFRIEAGDGKTPPGGTPGADFVSYLDGAERYLEVRLHTKWNNGAPYQDDGGGLPEWTGSYSRDDVLVGYGGHAVYIIGKRPVLPG